MARRRKSSGLLVAGVVKPADLAATVIGNYVSKAKTDLPSWAEKYTSNISDYLKDTTKQEMAKSKLEAWYDLFVNIIVPAIRETYAKAKAEYTKLRYTKARGVVTPPV
jgi:hypothetical protein